jgi:hypothetical protein
MKAKILKYRVVSLSSEKKLWSVHFYCFNILHKEQKQNSQCCVFARQEKTVTSKQTVLQKRFGSNVIFWQRKILQVDLLFCDSLSRDPFWSPALTLPDRPWNSFHCKHYFGCSNYFESNVSEVQIIYLMLVNSTGSKQDEVWRLNALFYLCTQV